MKHDYGVELPATLDTFEFADAWSEWEAYRKESKKKLTPRAVKMQVKELSTYPVAVVIKAINASIMNNWQGIFPEKYANTNGNHRPTTFDRNMQAYQKLVQELEDE